jgi:hypothetical protein
MPEIVQHPYDPHSQLYQAHCTVCGTYTHDSWFEPATDYICDPCIEAAEDDSGLPGAVTS